MSASNIDYLSHSRLESYRQCSLKFQFQYIEKLKPAFTPAPLALGVAFHRAVEVALIELMAGSFPPVDEMAAVVEATLEEQSAETPIHFGAKESKDTLLEHARSMLEAWVNWPRPAARIIAVEHEFKIPLAEWLPLLVGRVDLVEDHPDFLAVIDVKTSRSRWSEEDVAQHAGQLALYRAGVKALAQQLGKRVRVGFEIITKTKTPTVERLYLDDDKEGLERQVRTATLVLEAAERGICLPSPGWACISCPFRAPCRAWGTK